MNFLELVTARYACKAYSERQVPEEILTNILEAGRQAPTAKNLQEQHVYVLRSEAALKLLDAHTPCRYGAPTVLAVAFDKNRVFTYPGGSRDSGIEDAAIVATHMMLAAKAEGVESCWINYFEPEALEQALKLPENESLLMLLDLGYPAKSGVPLPNHFARRPLAETVTYL